MLGNFRHINYRAILTGCKRDDHRARLILSQFPRVIIQTTDNTPLRFLRFPRIAIASCSVITLILSSLRTSRMSRANYNYNISQKLAPRITNFRGMCGSRAPVSFPISPFRLPADLLSYRTRIYVYTNGSSCVLDWHVHTLHSCERALRVRAHR